MLPFFLVLNAIGWFRCDSVVELVGLDVACNGDKEQIKSSGSDTDSAVRDEYFEAYEEFKNKSCKKRGDKKCLALDQFARRIPRYEYCLSLPKCF
jgi:hypothetical protein